MGGAFLFTDRRDGVDVEHVGEYVEIARPARLVFDFAVPLYSAERTRVTINIAPMGDGCALTLTHEGVMGDYREKDRGRLEHHSGDAGASTRLNGADADAR